MDGSEIKRPRQFLQRRRAGRRKAPTRGEIRDSIDVYRLVQALQAAALGERAMTGAEIRAATVLLNKALPDMNKHTVSVEAPKGIMLTWGKRDT